MNGIGSATKVGNAPDVPCKINVSLVQTRPAPEEGVLAHQIRLTSQNERRYSRITKTNSHTRAPCIAMAL